MKKMTLLLPLFIALFTSCDNKPLMESDFKDYLQDEWQINNELRIINFKDNNYSVIKLFNSIEDEGVLYPIIGSEIGWKSSMTNDFGSIKYIKHTDDGTSRESIIIKGLPKSTNPIDTIHRIPRIN